jgi:CBS domain-containing protein
VDEEVGGMLTQRGIADQTLTAIEAGLGKGREAITTFMAEAPRAIMANAPRAMTRPPRRAPTLGPLWIGAGLLVGLAAVVLSNRRQTAPQASQDSRRLRDLMVTDVQTVEPGATVVEAAELMRQKNVGVLPVVENGRVVGVVTDRDLVVRVLAKRGADPSAVRVMDCATKNPVLGKVDWTPERALLIMAEQQIGRLPIVDEQGRLVGMVTLSSLALRSKKPDETLAAARKVSLRSAREDAA